MNFLTNRQAVRADAPAIVEGAMNKKTVALIGFILAIAAVIGYKQLQPQVVYAGNEPKVVLVADFREADEECACGEIIRAVRAAQKKGIATEEIDPHKAPQLLKQYRVLTAPTVLILNADGKEAARFEGEDKKTAATIKSYLDRMIQATGR